MLSDVPYTAATFLDHQDPHALSIEASNHKVSSQQISKADKEKLQQTKKNLDKEILPGNHNILNNKLYGVEDVYISPGGYEPHAVSHSKVDKQKLFELKIMDEKLGRGHIIYFLTNLVVLVVVGVNFFLHVDIALPLPLEIYRIILIGLLIYIMMSALSALREKKYYLQTVVVYYLKWYTFLLTVYTILKMIFLPKMTGLIIGINIAEIVLILAILWASKRVQDELKRREELCMEISFDSFFV